jgi:hypothetical protein
VKIDNFFSVLKRRNVLKFALVYAVVSWLLFELAWVLLPMWKVYLYDEMPLSKNLVRRSR